MREIPDNGGGRTLLIEVIELAFSMYHETSRYFESQERRHGKACTTSLNTTFAVLISTNGLYLFP